MEQYHIAAEVKTLAMKLIFEYDKHEAEEIDREVKVCSACPYFMTCKYSIQQTKKG